MDLVLLAVPALQALFGRACFLTPWQAMLEQEASARASQEPLIARLVDSVIIWSLPICFFAALYVAARIYALALWWLVPPRRSYCCSSPVDVQSLKTLTSAHARLGRCPERAIIKLMRP